MDIVSCDSETHLIQAGLLAPPVVCVGFHNLNTDQSELYTAQEGMHRFAELSEQPVLISGTNIAYDLACFAAHSKDENIIFKIFKALDDKKLYDVAIAEMLNAIALDQLGEDPRTGRPIKPEPGKKKGGYNLNYCTSLRLGRDDAKLENLAYWRTRFAHLENLRIADYPAEAVQYVIGDCRNPAQIAAKQIELAEQGSFQNLHNLADQVDTAFCLQLGSCWGMRIDRQRYEVFKQMLEDTKQINIEFYRSLGFVNDKGEEDVVAVKRAIAIAYGADPSSKCARCGGSGRVVSTSASAQKSKTAKYINCKVEMTENGTWGCDSTGLDITDCRAIPRTDSLGISKSRDTKVESGDESLMAYSENEGDKLRNTYLPYLARGLDIPINPQSNVLVNTGRVSYDEVTQLIPRQVSCGWCRGHKCAKCNFKGTVHGVRECHVARCGYLFSSGDYSAQELCSLSQVCLWLFGHSRMAEIINETGSPGGLHLAFAADLTGKTYEEALALYEADDLEIQMARQGAKAGNFGFGGAMGAAKLVLNKRSRREGTTKSPDGTVYPGIRFCILLGGYSRCGEEKVTEWKRRSYAPMCKRCVEIVESQLRPSWFKKFPEVAEYHKWCGKLVEDGGVGPCFRPCRICNGLKCEKCKYRGWEVERWRGGMDYSTMANNGFQALTSDGAKKALRRVVRECYGYFGKQAPLYGSRPLGLYHDEIIAEMPYGKSHDASMRMKTIMTEDMKYYHPDVTIVVQDPALMKWWSKNAKSKYDADKKLIPYDITYDEFVAMWQEGR